MNLPGFSAENSIASTGRTSPYRLTGRAGEAAGLYPQGITEADFTLARCLPQFGWVWAVCGHIDGNPVYCREIEFLGPACS